MSGEVKKTNHVLYRGADNNIHDIYFIREAGWRHTNMSVKHGSPQGAGTPSGYAFDPDQSNHVIYRGMDGQVHDLEFIRGRGWVHTSLSGITQAPMASSDPTAHIFHVFPSRHVMYRGADGHIHDIYWMEAAGWRHSDINEKTPGAPLPGGNPIGYSFTGDDSNHIVYRGHQGQIHDLCFIRGQGRVHTNLSAATGAPTAMGDPSVHIFHVFPSRHVMYRGADGHIHDIYWMEAAGWRHSDINEKTPGAPLPGGNPIGYSFTGDDSNHIVYRGVDGYIHDLCFIRGQGRVHTNLSASTGSPMAAGDPFGYTFDLFPSQHVIYRGVDGHIHQIYWMMEKGWRASNLTEKVGAPAPASDASGHTYDLR